MDIVFYGGIILFFIGLVLSHIVVVVTRSSVRNRDEMKKGHRVLMWCSVICVVVGFLMAGSSYVVLNVLQSAS